MKKEETKNLKNENCEEKIGYRRRMWKEKRTMKNVSLQRRGKCKEKSGFGLPCLVLCTYSHFPILSLRIPQLMTSMYLDRKMRKSHLTPF